MKTLLKTITLAMLIVSAMVATSEAGWLIFSESELKGQILDIDTKQPIEGAVVVVVYKTASPGLGAGQSSSYIDVGEALTDKEGKFLIPSYTTIIQPFSWKIPSTVIIYKPGYARFELGTWCFSGEDIKDKVQEGTLSGLGNLKYRLRCPPGLVELPILKTREERLYSMPDPVIEIDRNKQRLLIQLINEERSNLNLKDRYQLK